MLYWEVYTYTPWDRLNSQTLSKVRLMSILNVFDKYPLIGLRFFNDLKANIQQYPHYTFYNTIKRIVDPKNKDYTIQNWNFVWAMDKEKRLYQFLFQKMKRNNEMMAALVALAPLELVKLFSTHKKEAILKTLSLLNNHKTLSFATLLEAQGKSLAEESQEFTIDNKSLQRIQFSNYLKQQPNIQGQWFPHFSPKCPICGTFMKELEAYRIGFGKLICPQCGYEKYKNK
ncbi:MAG: hypothetical protein BAJALOKI1v1_140003 [Promethearchaeota archaeon]|nr:MAG: hypothetical protein BAJALOKI1v1_140003 [Candidatus Lokiarchaeota archaeon]